MKNDDAAKKSSGVLGGKKKYKKEGCGEKLIQGLRSFYEKKVIVKMRIQFKMLK